MAAFIFIGGLTLASGCGADPGLMPVDGTVTLDGRPVRGMIVTFAPQGENAGTGSLGYVDDQGRFTLTDARGETGIYVGTYRISFYPALKKGMTADDPAGVVAAPQAAGLPAIYLDPANSPVLATVSAGGCSIDVRLTRSGEGAAAVNRDTTAP
jgi:hypothetical protein